jgi:hypothetical protein
MNSGMPRVEIVEQVMLNDEASIIAKQSFHTFPSLTRLKNGDFLCSTLVGSTKTGPDGRICLFRSSDNCSTWDRVVPPSIYDEKEDPRYGYICCHLTELSDETIVAAYLRVQRFNPDESLFHPRTDGIQPTQVRLAFSDNHGQSWSKPKTIDYTDPDMIITGKCINLDNGVLGLPCEIWHEWESGFRNGPSARMIFSHDSGKSWLYASVMAMDPDKSTIFGDPRITVCGSGSLYAMFWRYSLKTGFDLNTHAAISDDSGRNWGPVIDTGIKGQISNPLWIDADFMACVYQDRFQQPGLRIVFSRDGGLTWDTENASSIWNADVVSGLVQNNPFQGYQAYSFGYSSVIQIVNNEYILAFWNGDSSSTNISFIKFRIILP